MSNGFELRGDKSAIKKNMSTDDVFNFLSEHGVNGRWVNEEQLIFETCCHNHLGEGSHRLFYYDNTKLFKCYTNCGEFDIFDLIIRMNQTNTGEEITLGDAIKIYTERQGFLVAGSSESSAFSEEEKEYCKPAITEYEKDVLHYPLKAIVDTWVGEGISEETQRKFGIGLNSLMMSITFPHFGENWELYGVRQRMLSQENVDRYGKYRPLERGETLYSSPLSFYLFGLNHTGLQIRVKKKAIVFEGEKSVMKMDSIMGSHNNISVASFGMKLSRHQFEILKNMGVEEIIIAFDRQFREVGDKEFKELVSVYQSINDRYGEKGVKLSFILDSEKISDYKDSPIDKGVEVFSKLYSNKKSIEEVQEVLEV